MANEKKFITCDGNYAAAHIAYMFRKQWRGERNSERDTDWTREGGRKRSGEDGGEEGWEGEEDSERDTDWVGRVCD